MEKAVSKSILYLILLVLGTFLSPQSLFANDISLMTGISAVEQGDFVLQPSIRVRGEYKSTYNLIWDFYGRDYQSIQERTNIISFAVKPKITRFGPGFSLLFGGSILDEYTKYSPQTDEGTDFNSLIVGGYLGEFTGTTSSKRFRVGFSWDAMLYPAGVATLYLVTSRKQVINFSVGVNI